MFELMLLELTQGVHVNGTLVRPAAKPSVDVRPGALVRPAPRHNTDVPSRDTEEFLVAASHFGEHGLRLARRSDVIPFGDDCKQIGAQSA